MTGVFDVIHKRIDDTITVATDKKIQFRDTGIYIQSNADGKLTISSDGSGADDIILSGNVTISDDLVVSGTMSYGAISATTLAATGDVTLCDAKADTVTIKGDVVGDGTENPDFDYSSSSGTFKTSTGAVTISGDTTISGAKTFTTGTGNVTIKGDMSIDAGKDFDMSAGAGTFATGTGAVSLNGDTTIAADKNVSCSGGTTEVDFSGGTGAFKTTTGAVTIGGNTTISGAKTLTTGTGLTTISGTLQCDGDQINDSGGASTISFDGSGNTTVDGNLTVTGTHTFSDASITGDLDIVGTDLQATTGTLNISKSGSATTIKGTLNVDEAVTFDTTLGVTGAATFSSTVQLGDAKADTVTFYGDVAANGTQNPDIDFSGSSGTFKTSTGAGTLGCSSLGISGDVTVSSGKDIVLQGAGYLQSVNAQITNIKAHDGTASIDITDSTGAVGIAGAVTMAADKNVSCASGTTEVDWSAGSGAFKTTTGAVTIGGNTTISGSKTFTTGTGNVSIKGDMSIDAGKDFDMSGGAGTFATGTGAVSLNGATTLGSAIALNMGSGSTIGGVLTVYRDTNGAKSLILTPGTSLTVSEDVTINSTYTFTTGTGDTTISGDISISGHKDGMTFMVNAFQYPNPGTDWTPEQAGAGLGANLAAKKVWIPLNFLQIGDEIVSYKLVGDMHEEGGDTVTLDCSMNTVNKADPITFGNIGGSDITQVAADGNFDAAATLSSVETVATDTMYVLEILGTTSNVSSNEKIEVMGAEVVINRK